MKLKIAQVTPYYYPSVGGVSGVCQYLSEELVKLGHKVDVITARRDHKGRPKLNAPKHEVINDVNVFRYKSIINIGHMSFFPSLITHLISKKYDVVHFHSYRHPLCDISAVLGKVKSSVTILHGHGPFFEKNEISNTKKKIYDMYDKFAYHTVFKLTDKVIALNNYEKKRYTDIGIEPQKIVVVPNAASADCFVKTDNREFISNYNLSDKKVLLFVGILNSFKRPDLLIEALPKIIKEVNNVHLLLVGPDGGMLEKVTQLAKELNVEEYYSWLGPLQGTEKQNAYESAHIFVLPSDWDAYPLVLMEALAHGLPCVTTDCRGPIDIVEHGKTGFVVKKRETDDMAAKIINLLKNDELYNEFSRNAKMVAEKKYKADSIAQYIENLYYHLLKN